MKRFLSRVHSAYDAPSPADARETRSIFKPRMRRPNFLASVVVNTIRALALIVLILMLAGIVSFVFSPMALLYPKTIAAQDVQPLRLAPIPVAGLIGFVALTALNVVLDFGIHVPAP